MNFIKDALDDYIAHLPSKAIAFLNSLMLFTAGLTLSDWLDLSQKWVTVIVTVVVGMLSIRHYVLRNRLKEKEIALKDQELYKAISENKNKNGRGTKKDV